MRPPNLFMRRHEPVTVWASGLRLQYETASRKSATLFDANDWREIGRRNDPGDVVITIEDRREPYLLLLHLPPMSGGASFMTSGRAWPDRRPSDRRDHRRHEDARRAGFTAWSALRDRARLTLELPASLPQAPAIAPTAFVEVGQMLGQRGEAVEVVDREEVVDKRERGLDAARERLIVRRTEE